MAGLLGIPKPPPVLPPINPADTANRANNAMALQLAGGGVNADNTSGRTVAPVGAGRQPTLTGLN